MPIPLGPSTLHGDIICFTGRCSFSRNHMESIVISEGASFRKNLTMKCTLLVAANPNSNSSKIKKARSYGIPIIDEEEIFELCNDYIPTDDLELEPIIKEQKYKKPPPKSYTKPAAKLPDKKSKYSKVRRIVI